MVDQWHVLALPEGPSQVPKNSVYIESGHSSGLLNNGPVTWERHGQGSLTTLASFHFPRHVTRESSGRRHAMAMDGLQDELAGALLPCPLLPCGPVFMLVALNGVGSGMSMPYGLLGWGRGWCRRGVGTPRGPRGGQCPDCRLHCGTVHR